MSRILQLLSGWFTAATGFVLLRRTGHRYADARRAFDYIGRSSGFQPLKVVDIGAHKGGFAREWLRARPQDSLLCIEANPALKEEFWRTVAHSLHVRLHSLAIAESNGMSQFNVCHSTATSSLLKPSDTAPTEYLQAMKVTHVRDTPCETLDHFMAMEGLQRVDVIKMDVQGGEASVLRGGRKAFSGASYVICELQFRALYDSAGTAESLITSLKEHGFHLVMLFDLNYCRTGELIWADGLFARDRAISREDPMTSNECAASTDSEASSQMLSASSQSVAVGSFTCP